MILVSQKALFLNVILWQLCAIACMEILKESMNGQWKPKAVLNDYINTHQTS